jgi:hypothetical protein
VILPPEKGSYSFDKNGYKIQVKYIPVDAESAKLTVSDLLIVLDLSMAVEGSVEYELKVYINASNEKVETLLSVSSEKVKVAVTADSRPESVQNS